MGRQEGGKVRRKETGTKDRGFPREKPQGQHASLPLISVEKADEVNISPFEQKQKALLFAMRTVYKTN